MGCNGLVGTVFITFIIIAVISGLTNSRNEVTKPLPTTESTGAIQPEANKPETPPSTTSASIENPGQSDRIKTKTPGGSGIQLKDSSSFPVTIVVTRKIDILNEVGGFGLDAGDELLVLRKQDTKYVVSHQNKEYTVNLNLIEDMRIK